MVVDRNPKDNVDPRWVNQLRIHGGAAMNVQRCGGQLSRQPRSGSQSFLLSFAKRILVHSDWD